MRTMVTLDEDVAAKLQQTADEGGASFKSALNDAIRSGLAVGVPPSRPRPPAATLASRDGAIHLVWPPTRLDVFSILAFAVVAYAAVEREWIMVGIALFAILIAVVLPRMTGPFEVGGPVRLKGELIDHQVRLRGVVGPSQPSRTGEPTQDQPPAPLGTTRPPGG